jgi:hypothetical protein
LGGDACWPAEKNNGEGRKEKGIGRLWCTDLARATLLQVHQQGSVLCEVAAWLKHRSAEKDVDGDSKVAELATVGRHCSLTETPIFSPLYLSNQKATQKKQMHHDTMLQEYNRFS